MGRTAWSETPEVAGCSGRVITIGWHPSPTSWASPTQRLSPGLCAGPGPSSLPSSIHQVCITFDQADLTIKLPDGHEFKFPNRLNMEAINYMAADGDFKIKCLAFD